MLKTLATASAVVALLAAAPAVAQNSTTGAQPSATSGQTQPAPKPVQPTPATPAPSAGNQAAAPANTTTQTATSQKFLSQEQQGEMLASNIMGKTVYDSSGNNLGSVSDIVIGKDGKLDAVVVGVGGFLGIGQKNVAVSMSAINTSMDGKGELKLVLNATKDELDKAPAFKTIADLQSEQNQSQPQAPAAGTGVNPAPAPGAAPGATPGTAPGKTGSSM